MGQTCSGQTCGFQRPGAFGEGIGTPRPAPAPLRGTLAYRRGDEVGVEFHARAFRVSVAKSEASNSPSARGSRQGWRAAYSLGAILGDGISAKVYEAEALPSGMEGVQGIGAVGAAAEAGLLWGSCGTVAVPPCLRERGRKVAIKRFHRVGSRTYQKELAALRRVSVHPNVLRLLESFEGFDNEDVLVLEYCDGSTLYDLYAREHPNGGLPERLVARLIRQLLLALEHLHATGVEHQDVKPENMMLHGVSAQSGQAELKLGDFGWASIALAPGSAARAKQPSTGAGSLWYAPPELNPPVQGVTTEVEAPTDAQGRPLLGRSDLWSVGVVLYLLLVGHNPFNTALKQPNPEAVDAEVLRLAALGSINRRAEKWLHLHIDARDFISVLMRVRAKTRPSASEALQLPFLTRRVSKNYESAVLFHGAVASWHDREQVWGRLDGFQRLAWVAVARAVAEPELDRSVIAGALDGMQHGEEFAGAAQDATYLWQLARELATVPVFQWLTERGAWLDVLRLAFSYVDVDADGVLSARDLVLHIVGPGPTAHPALAAALARAGDDEVHREPAAAAPGASAGGALACHWISRWQDPTSRQPLLTSNGNPGLAMTSFREALLSSQGADDALFAACEDDHDVPAAAAAAAAAAAVADVRHTQATQRDSLEAEPNLIRPVRKDEEEINWTEMAPPSQALGRDHGRRLSQ